MERLFDISADFAELFDQFDSIGDMEFQTDENGNPVDDEGNPVDPEFVKAQMREAWFDTLECTECEFMIKAENTAQYIKHLKAESDAIDAEIKKLQARSKSRKNRIDSLKQYLMTCMKQMELKKVDGVQARITIRKNAPSIKIADELALITELQDTGKEDLLKYLAPEIRKTELKKLCKAGEKFTGVTLESSESLLIS